MKTETKTKAYKAFNKNWTCRDFKFEVGKDYTHKDKIEPCQSGFHAYENPLDVLDYYNLTESVFAEVEVSGEIKRDGNKCCAEHIKIVREINIFDFINIAVENILADSNAEISSGDYSTAASSGDYSTAASSGYSSKAEVNGEHCAAAAVGYNCRIKGSLGTPVALCHYVDGKPVKFVCGVIGLDGLKADTWYWLDSNGNFEEVN